MHTHSPEVIALSAGRDELPAIHYAITGLGGPVRVAPYVRFGSAGLAASAVTALDGRSAVILRNHGAVCLRPRPGPGLRPGAAARVAGPHLPARAELRRTRDPVGRRTRRGHGRVPAPPLRRAAQRPAMSTAHERAPGARPRLATGNSDGARRAHPGRAGPPGRGDPARPGQRPAEGDPGHRRGHGRRDRRRPGQARGQGARRRRARRRPARRHRDRRDGQARRGHRRADPQERRPDVGHHPAHPAERRAARASTSRARRGCSPAPTSTWTPSRTAAPCSSAPRTRSPG